MHHYTGYRPLRFVVRIHAFAGQPFVRLQHTIVFHLNPRETQVAEIGLRLPLRDGGGAILCRSASEPHRAAALPPGGELLLAQQEDNHFRQLEAGSGGPRVSEGERTEGWLTAESAAGGLGVPCATWPSSIPRRCRPAAAASRPCPGITRRDGS